MSAADADGLRVQTSLGTMEAIGIRGLVALVVIVGLVLLAGGVLIVARLNNTIEMGLRDLRLQAETQAEIMKDLVRDRDRIAVNSATEHRDIAEAMRIQIYYLLPESERKSLVKPSAANLFDRRYP